MFFCIENVGKCVDWGVFDLSLYWVYKKFIVIVDIDKIVKFCFYLFLICNLIVNVFYVFFRVV